MAEEFFTFSESAVRQIKEVVRAYMAQHKNPSERSAPARNHHQRRAFVQITTAAPPDGEGGGTILYWDGDTNSWELTGIDLTNIRTTGESASAVGDRVWCDFQAGYWWISDVDLDCPQRNEIQQITATGGPTAGTFDLVVRVPDTNGDYVSAVVTVNWNDTAAALKTAIATAHSEIETTDLDVVGGPFPDATVEVEFIGNFAGVDVPIMRADWGSLTGGSGMSVICSVVQDGYPEAAKRS